MEQRPLWRESWRPLHHRVTRARLWTTGSTWVHGPCLHLPSGSHHHHRTFTMYHCCPPEEKSRYHPRSPNTGAPSLTTTRRRAGERNQRKRKKGAVAAGRVLTMLLSQDPIKWSLSFTQSPLHHFQRCYSLSKPPQKPLIVHRYRRPQARKHHPPRRPLLWQISRSMPSALSPPSGFSCSLPKRCCVAALFASS